jgi:hypothetical protein
MREDRVGIIVVSEVFAKNLTEVNKIDTCIRLFGIIIDFLSTHIACGGSICVPSSPFIGK